MRSIPFTLILLTAFASGQAVRDNKPPQLGSEAHRFLGSWQVVSVTDTRPDGTVVPDLYLGPHPVGVVIYDAEGFMCAGSMNPDRSKWSDGSNGTQAEMADAAKGYDTYCGTYTVDEERQTVTHHVRVGLVPNDVGTDLKRTYEFSGEQLKLSGTEGLLPGFKFWTFTLERAKR